MLGKAIAEFLSANADSIAHHYLHVVRDCKILVSNRYRQHCPYAKTNAILGIFVGIWFRVRFVVLVIIHHQAFHHYLVILGTDGF